MDLTKTKNKGDGMDLTGIGTLIGGAGSLFGALDQAFGSGKKALDIAKDNLNFQKDQARLENQRYNENKKNLQANVDMVGSIFDDKDDTFTRI